MVSEFDLYKDEYLNHKVPCELYYSEKMTLRISDNFKSHCKWLYYYRWDILKMWLVNDATKIENVKILIFWELGEHIHQFVKWVINIDLKTFIQPMLHKWWNVSDELTLSMRLRIK